MTFRFLSDEKTVKADAFRPKVRAEHHYRSVAQEVTHILAQALDAPKPLSLLELEGLGSPAWTAVDAAHHVASERESWD